MCLVFVVCKVMEMGSGFVLSIGFETASVGSLSLELNYKLNLTPIGHQF